MLGILLIAFLCTSLSTCTATTCENECIKNYDNSLERACIGSCGYYHLLTFNKANDAYGECVNKCDMRYFGAEVSACKKGCDYASSLVDWFKDKATSAFEKARSNFSWMWQKVKTFFNCFTSQKPVHKEIETKNKIYNVAKTETVHHMPEKEENAVHTVWVTRLRVFVFGPGDGEHNKELLPHGPRHDGIHHRDALVKYPGRSASVNHRLSQQLFLQTVLAILGLVGLLTASLVVFISCLCRARRVLLAQRHTVSYQPLPTYDETLLLTKEKSEDTKDSEKAADDCPKKATLMV